MIDDTVLLRRYAEERAEEAFAEFVRRQLPFVYGAALRRLGGDAHAAQDVAQTVFIAVARDARRLSHHALLPGWLYTTTRNAVVDMLRSEQRRRARERELGRLQEIGGEVETQADWSRLAPVLDAALDELGEKDRAAVLLRFFQNRAFNEIAASLGVNEEAARKRVGRALDKLRTGLRRRGVASTSAALAIVLASGAASAVPPIGAAATITAAALSGATAAIGTAAFLAVSKLQIGMVAALLAGSAVALITQQRTVHAWRETATASQAQAARLAADNAALVRAQAESESRNVALAQARAEAESDAQRLRADLTALQQANITASRKLATPALPTIGVKGEPRGLGPLPATPEIERRKAAWHHRYDPFFQQRGLTTEEGNRFVELKIHQEIARADFQAAVRAANLRGDSQAVQALRAKDDSPVTRGLLELLGPEGYSAYRDYEKSSALRVAYVEPAQAELVRANLPLSPAQAEGLLMVFSRNARSVQARPTDIGTTGLMDWDGVVAQAGTWLSPAQLAVLRSYVARPRVAPKSE